MIGGGIPGGPFSVFIGVDGDALGGVEDDLAGGFKTLFITLRPQSDLEEGDGDAVACRDIVRLGSSAADSAGRFGLGVVGGVDMEYC